MWHPRGKGMCTFVCLCGKCLFHFSMKNLREHHGLSGKAKQEEREFYSSNRYLGFSCILKAFGFHH